MLNAPLYNVEYHCSPWSYKTPLNECMKSQHYLLDLWNTGNPWNFGYANFFHTQTAHDFIKWMFPKGTNWLRLRLRLRLDIFNSALLQFKYFLSNLIKYIFWWDVFINYCIYAFITLFHKSFHSVRNKQDKYIHCSAGHALYTSTICIHNIIISTNA